MIGAATMTGTTNVDNDKHLVTVHGIQVTNSYFPDRDPATSAKMDQLLRTFVPPVVNISLERVVAYVPKQQAQSLNQERSSGGISSESLNSEMQNRQRGETSSQNWQHGGSGGGWAGAVPGAVATTREVRGALFVEQHGGGPARTGGGSNMSRTVWREVRAR